MMLDWSRGEELGSYISEGDGGDPGPEIQNPPRTLQRRAPVIKLVGSGAGGAPARCGDEIVQRTTNRKAQGAQDSDAGECD